MADRPDDLLVEQTKVPEDTTKPCNICGRGWPYHYEACAYAATARECNRYLEALRSLAIFLAPSRETGLHTTLGEACGIDACILCLAEHTVKDALGHV